MRLLSDFASYNVCLDLPANELTSYWIIKIKPRSFKSSEHNNEKGMGNTNLRLPRSEIM